MGMLEEAFNKRARLWDAQEKAEAEAIATLATAAAEFEAQGLAQRAAGVKADITAAPGAWLKGPSMTITARGMTENPKAPEAAAPQLTLTIEAAPRARPGHNPVAEVFYRANYDVYNCLGTEGAGEHFYTAAQMVEHLHGFIAQVEKAAGGLTPGQVRAVATALAKPPEKKDPYYGMLRARGDFPVA